MFFFIIIPIFSFPESLVMFAIQVHSQLVRGQIESESRPVPSKSDALSVHIPMYPSLYSQCFFHFRLRVKVPEKRANFNSNAADRLWGGGAPASNNWASGAGMSSHMFVAVVS